MKRRGEVAGAGVVLAALVLTGCTLGQMPPREQVCTLIGCGASLEVALVGEHVPTEFSMTVMSRTEDIVNVRCTDGNAVFDPPEAARWSPACPAGGVTFQNFAPAQLTVTVRWSEGEVTQELAPVYIQRQPNGPQCEPTCNSARVEVRIPTMPAYGDPSTWATYADDRYGFQFKYPPALKLEVRPDANEYRTVFVGDQMRVRTTADDPLACRGDCPMIESSEVVNLAGRQAHQLRGYIGSIGGNVPQQFMIYLIRLNETYVSFELYAEGRDVTTDDPSVIRQLTEQDTELFGRIMQSVKFET